MTEQIVLKAYPRIRFEVSLPIANGSIYIVTFTQVSVRVNDTAQHTAWHYPTGKTVLEVEIMATKFALWVKEQKKVRKKSAFAVLGDIAGGVDAVSGICYDGEEAEPVPSSYRIKFVDVKYSGEVLFTVNDGVRIAQVYGLDYPPHRITSYSPEDIALYTELGRQLASI
jgi:hypothetical protein